jgi:hypothetical protein
MESKYDTNIRSRRQLRFVVKQNYKTHLNADDSTLGNEIPSTFNRMTGVPYRMMCSNSTANTTMAQDLTIPYNTYVTCLSFSIFRSKILFMSSFSFLLLVWRSSIYGTMSFAQMIATLKCSLVWLWLQPSLA